MAVMPLKRKYRIEELVGALNLTDSYLIIDPDTKKTLGVVNEETTFKEMVGRLFLDKSLLSTRLVMYNANNEMVLEMCRPPSLLKARFIVKNYDGRVLCVFRQRFSLFKPGILVEDSQGRELGTIEGGWGFKNFRFKDANSNTIASLRHRFSGIKDLLTTSDDYELSIIGDDSMTLVSLAAVICIDVLYHES